MVNYEGRSVGEYQLTTLLGKGTFGDVYLGEHQHEHTLAAVKLLQARLSAQDLKEFINEASIIFRLKHPHIVQLLGFGIEKDDIPFLAMSYAPHGTLRRIHPKGTQLSLATIVSYVTPIASALQYAHDQGFIHRDVKPENILLGPNHEIWLSDFGIAVVAQSTKTGNLLTEGGTPPYMAPEQLQGRPQPASDQYALGIMVYEWLCGERPFNGNTLEVAIQHIQAPIPSLHEKVPLLPADVEQVVMTALAKDPKRRFATVQAFATTLSQCIRAGNSVISTGTVDESLISTMLIEQDTSIRAPILEPISTPSLQPTLSVKGEGIPTTLKPSQRKTLKQRLILAVSIILVLLVVSVSLLKNINGNNILPGLSHNGSPTTGRTGVATPLVDPQTAAAAEQQYDQDVATNGVMLGFDAGHTNVNPYEKILSPMTVSHLKQAWSSQDTDLNGSPTIAYGNVYVGANDHNLYAFYADSGKVHWRQPTGGKVESTPAVADGMVFVGSDDGMLYAFDAQKGTISWSVMLGSPSLIVSVMTSPTVVNDVLYVGVNTFDTWDNYDYLYAVNAKSGKTLWKVPFGNNISAPAIAGGVVFIKVCGSIFAFYANSGKPFWMQSVNGDCDADPVVGNGLVYVNSGQNLYALDTTTHRQRWVSQSGSGDIAIENGVVYTSDSGLQALNATTGDPLEPTWTVLAQVGAGSPTIANGVIYDCSNDGNLYAFNLKTQAQLWSFTVSSAGYIASFPPTPVVANGTVYINVGRLLAFRLPGA